MKKPEILKFEMEIQHILDWSAIDTGTKSVLMKLMEEVAALAEELHTPK